MGLRLVEQQDYRKGKMIQARRYNYPLAARGRSQPALRTVLFRHLSVTKSAKDSR